MIIQLGKWLPELVTPCTQTIYQVTGYLVQPFLFVYWFTFTCILDCREIWHEVTAICSTVLAIDMFLWVFWLSHNCANDLISTLHLWWDDEGWFFNAHVGFMMIVRVGYTGVILHFIFATVFFFCIPFDLSQHEMTKKKFSGPHKKLMCAGPKSKNGRRFAPKWHFQP